jgi:hypothetical protein
VGDDIRDGALDSVCDGVMGLVVPVGDAFVLADALMKLCLIESWRSAWALPVASG